MLLQRGKFRPRLTEMVKENEEEDVRAVTQKAFSQMPNLETALQTLTKLKAVGPATASGQC